MVVDIELVLKCLKIFYVYVSFIKIFLGNGGISIWEKLFVCIFLKLCLVYIFFIEEF